RPFHRSPADRHRSKAVASNWSRTTATASRPPRRWRLAAAVGRASSSCQTCEGSTRSMRSLRFDSRRPASTPWPSTTSVARRAWVIGFYGWPGGRGEQDPQAPINRVKSYACPVLGLFGGADQGIPTETVEDFRQALDEAGVSNEIVIYPGAPHSFFDRAFAQYADACDDAWRRMLAFMNVSAP